MKYTALAKLVRDRRIAVQQSQRELARRADISPGYVGWIERGDRSPSRDVCRSLARALYMAEEDLLEAAGHVPPGTVLHLDTDEVELVTRFRRALPYVRRLILGGLREVTETEADQPGNQVVDPSREKTRVAEDPRSYRADQA